MRRVPGICSRYILSDTVYNIQRLFESQEFGSHYCNDARDTPLECLHSGCVEHLVRHGLALPQASKLQEQPCLQ